MEEASDLCNKGEQRPTVSLYEDLDQAVLNCEKVKIASFIQTRVDELRSQIHSSFVHEKKSNQGFHLDSQNNYLNNQSFNKSPISRDTSRDFSCIVASFCTKGDNSFYSTFRNTKETRHVTPLAQRDRNIMKDSDSRSYSTPSRSKKSEIPSAHMRGARIILSLLRKKLQHGLDAIREHAYLHKRKAMIISGLEGHTSRRSRVSGHENFEKESIDGHDSLNLSYSVKKNYVLTPAMEREKILHSTHQKEDVSFSLIDELYNTSRSNVKSPERDCPDHPGFSRSSILDNQQPQKKMQRTKSSFITPDLGSQSKSPKTIKISELFPENSKLSLTKNNNSQTPNKTDRSGASLKSILNVNDNLTNRTRLSPSKSQDHLTGKPGSTAALNDDSIASHHQFIQNIRKLKDSFGTSSKENSLCETTTSQAGQKHNRSLSQGAQRLMSKIESVKNQIHQRNESGTSFSHKNDVTSELVQRNQTLRPQRVESIHQTNREQEILRDRRNYDQEDEVPQKDFDRRDRLRNAQKNPQQLAFQKRDMNRLRGELNENQNEIIINYSSRDEDDVMTFNPPMLSEELLTQGNSTATLQNTLSGNHLGEEMNSRPSFETPTLVPESFKQHFSREAYSASNTASNKQLPKGHQKPGFGMIVNASDQVGSKRVGSERQLLELSSLHENKLAGLSQRAKEKVADKFVSASENNFSDGRPISDKTVLREQKLQGGYSENRNKALNKQFEGPTERNESFNDNQNLYRQMESTKNKKQSESEGSFSALKSPTGQLPLKSGVRNQSGEKAKYTIKNQDEETPIADNDSFLRLEAELEKLENDGSGDITQTIKREKGFNFGNYDRNERITRHGQIISNGEEENSEEEYQNQLQQPTKTILPSQSSVKAFSDREASIKILQAQDKLSDPRIREKSFLGETNASNRQINQYKNTDELPRKMGSPKEHQKGSQKDSFEVQLQSQPIDLKKPELKTSGFKTASYLTSQQKPQIMKENDAFEGQYSSKCTNDITPSKTSSQNWEQAPKTTLAQHTERKNLGTGQSFLKGPIAVETTPKSSATRKGEGIHEESHPESSERLHPAIAGNLTSNKLGSNPLSDRISEKVIMTQENESDYYEHQIRTEQVDDSIMLNKAATPIGRAKLNKSPYQSRIEKEYSSGDSFLRPSSRELLDHLQKNTTQQPGDSSPNNEIYSQLDKNWNSETPERASGQSRNNQGFRDKISAFNTKFFSGYLNKQSEAPQDQDYIHPHSSNNTTEPIVHKDASYPSNEFSKTISKTTSKTTSFALVSFGMEKPNLLKGIQFWNIIEKTLWKKFMKLKYDALECLIRTAHPQDTRFMFKSFTSSKSNNSQLPNIPLNFGNEESEAISENPTPNSKAGSKSSHSLKQSDIILRTSSPNLKLIDTIFYKMNKSFRFNINFVTKLDKVIGKRIRDNLAAAFEILKQERVDLDISLFESFPRQKRTSVAQKLQNLYFLLKSKLVLTYNHAFSQMKLVALAQSATTRRTISGIGSPRSKTRDHSFSQFGNASFLGNQQFNKTAVLVIRNKLVEIYKVQLRDAWRQIYHFSLQRFVKTPHGKRSLLSTRSPATNPVLLKKLQSILESKIQNVNLVKTQCLKLWKYYIITLKLRGLKLFDACKVITKATSRHYFAVFKTLVQQNYITNLQSRLKIQKLSSYKSGLAHISSLLLLRKKTAFQIISQYPLAPLDSLSKFEKGQSAIISTKSAGLAQMTSLIKSKLHQQLSFSFGRLLFQSNRTLKVKHLVHLINSAALRIKLSAFSEIQKFILSSGYNTKALRAEKFFNCMSRPFRRQAKEAFVQIAKISADETRNKLLKVKVPLFVHNIEKLFFKQKETAMRAIEMWVVDWRNKDLGAMNLMLKLMMMVQDRESSDLEEAFEQIRQYSEHMKLKELSSMNAYQEGCWQLSLLVKRFFFRDFKRVIENEKETSIKFNLAAKSVSNIINRNNRGNLNEAFQLMKGMKKHRSSIRRDAHDRKETPEWRVKVLKDKIVKNIQVLTHFSSLAMRKEHDVKVYAFQLLRKYRQLNTDVSQIDYVVRNILSKLFYKRVYLGFSQIKFFSDKRLQSAKSAFQQKLNKWNKVILRQHFKKWRSTAQGLQKMEEARLNYCKHLLKKKVFEGWMSYSKGLRMRVRNFTDKLMKVYHAKRTRNLGIYFEAIRTHVPRIKLTLVPTPTTKRTSITPIDPTRSALKNDAARRYTSKGPPTMDSRRKQSISFANDKSFDQKRQLQLSHVSSSRDFDEESQTNNKSVTSQQGKSPQTAKSGKSLKFFPVDTPKKPVTQQWSIDSKWKK